MRTESLKTIIIIILMFVLYIVLSMKSCNNNPCKIKDGGTTVVHKTDTVYKYMKDTVTVSVPILNPIYIIDTIFNEPNGTLMVYDNKYEDTNIVGTIHSITKGELLVQDLKYKLKKPLETIIMDSIIVTHTIIIDSTEKPKVQLGIGLAFTAPYTMITPSIFVKSKNNSIFGVGYDFLNKNYQVQFIKILNFKK